MPIEILFWGEYCSVTKFDVMMVAHGFSHNVKCQLIVDKTIYDLMMAGF